jgi:RNA polymerase sigma-70 factor (ECF subfamily)
MLTSYAGPNETPGIKMDLEQAIARLPNQARMVFVLFQIEGYSHEEIAVLTGMAVGSSKAHLHRARQLLREMLAL